MTDASERLAQLRRAALIELPQVYKAVRDKYRRDFPAAMDQGAVSQATAAAQSILKGVPEELRLPAKLKLKEMLDAALASSTTSEVSPEVFRGQYLCTPKERSEDDSIGQRDSSTYRKPRR